MTERILSIAGKPGLFKLVSQGKNMLIVESLATGKRMPAYSHDKVVSLADVSIYTNEGDTPLYDIFDTIKNRYEGQPVDYKKLPDAEVRELFRQVVPEFDDDRVYTNDMRKVFSWYNQLIAAGITEFRNEEIAEDEADEAAEKADESK